MGAGKFSFGSKFVRWDKGTRRLPIAAKYGAIADTTVRVALDTNPLYTTRAGVARYVRGLLEGLDTLTLRDDRVEPWAWPVENFNYTQPLRMLKTAWRELAWAKWSGSLRLRQDRYDLLHSTALPLVEYPVCRHVVTLHDLGLLRHPQRYRRWQLRNGLRRLQQVTQADHVIAVSQFTADEAMALLEIPAKRITVVHHGVTLAKTEIVPVNLPTEFYLFVGSLEPGKNLALLRQVWLEARQNGNQLPPLVIVGARWAGVKTEGEAPANWIFLGHQADEVLLALYRRAQALLFPSIYEGFGLPILEAMAAGCPVICGRVASLPEVGADAVLYAELTAENFAQAMQLLRADDALGAQLRVAGLCRSTDFSWTQCARETVAVWRQTSGV
ncbi:MAG: glycosyltransferase family 4 protein [Cephaloticoccus sp.]|nr:glycosyltransferase family 4 protein [Cephaloticoccus sp.]MCF7760661.1 glycosyltransferase family 4 protein [Cephaloticoccus sp.]